MPTRSSSRHQQELLPEDVQPLPAGHYCAGYLDSAAHAAVVSDVQAILAEAPPFEQKMPRTGAPLVTGVRWVAIPYRLSKIWADTTLVTEVARLCLITFYGRGALLGLHQDKGDASLAAPVLSISLGDDAIFSCGTEKRRSSLRRLEPHSGDVIRFGDQSRMVYHGVERFAPSSSNWRTDFGYAEGGRIHITSRRIDRALLVRAAYRNAEFRD